MKTTVLRAAVLAAVLPAFAAGCAPSAAAPTSQVAAAPGTARLAVPDFTRLVEQAGAAVVNISVTQKARPAAQALPFDKDDPFYEFFRRFQLPAPNQAPRHGVGSGFIVSPEGHILTNAHVVDGAKEVDVKLTDRREFVAKVVGVDPKSDVALIKIDARDLPVVRIGNPDEVKVGQWVVAMGSPFGFENSVTAGIVSAKSRSLGDGYVPFIQTDVAVNPGNSGGPLFDLEGNVVGINSQIYSRTGGYMGLSFAIPIDVAMHVKGELQAHGKVTRGRIGVTIQSLNQSLAQSFGLEKAEGALVSSVDDDGPAARAGIQPGDVILAWNGKPVSDSAALPVLVARTAPGEQAKVRLWRDGKERVVQVEVGTMPGENAAVASAGSPGADAGKLGLTLREGDDGLVVQDAAGAAAAAGVRAGDVILALNNAPVKSVEQLRARLEGAGKHVALLVQRGETKMYVPVEVG